MSLSWVGQAVVKARKPRIREDIKRWIKSVQGTSLLKTNLTRRSVLCGLSKKTTMKDLLRLGITMLIENSLDMMMLVKNGDQNCIVKTVKRIAKARAVMAIKNLVTIVNTRLSSIVKCLSARAQFTAAQMINTITKSRVIKNSINHSNESTNTKEAGPLLVNTTETPSFVTTTLGNSTNTKAPLRPSIKLSPNQMNAPFTLKINNAITECESNLNTTLRLTRDVAIQTFTTESSKTLKKGPTCETIGCAKLKKAIQILTVIEGIHLACTREIGKKEDHAVEIEVQFPLIHKPELTNKGGTTKSLKETIENTCPTSGNPGAIQEI